MLQSSSRGRAVASSCRCRADFGAVFVALSGARIVGRGGLRGVLRRLLELLLELGVLLLERGGAVAFVELSAAGAAAAPVHCSQPCRETVAVLLFHEHFSVQSPAYVWHRLLARRRWREARRQHFRVPGRSRWSPPAAGPPAAGPPAAGPPAAGPPAAGPPAAGPPAAGPGWGWGVKRKPCGWIGIHGFGVESAGRRRPGAPGERRSRRTAAATRSIFAAWGVGVPAAKGDVSSAVLAFGGGGVAAEPAPRRSPNCGPASCATIASRPSCSRSCTSSSSSARCTRRSARRRSPAGPRLQALAAARRGRHDVEGAPGADGEAERLQSELGNAQRAAQDWEAKHILAEQRRRADAAARRAGEGGGGRAADDGGGVDEASSASAQLEAERARRRRQTLRRGGGPRRKRGRGRARGAAGGGGARADGGAGRAPAQGRRARRGGGAAAAAAGARRRRRRRTPRRSARRRRRRRR